MSTLGQWLKKADDKVALLVILLGCVPILLFGLALKLWQRRFR